MDEFTTFLYARPSFIEGVARLLDFGGTLNEYNSSPSGAMADRFALEADWRAIQQDFQAVIGVESPGLPPASEPPSSRSNG
jgi:hypothetical protein